MTGPHSPVNPQPDPTAVRAALARVLALGRFQQGEDARLLRFAVEEGLDGRRAGLHEAEVVKLRARLSEYYAGEGRRDPVRIDLPQDGSPAVFSSVAPRARRLWVWAPASLAAAALLVWAGTWLHARIASARIRSLAILPFADLTPQPNGEWFAASFTGETIDALNRVPGLRVVARNSAFQVKSDASRQLGVAAVLKGSVRHAGDRLHIALQMARTSDGFRLWSVDFDSPAQDPQSAQEAVAAAIARRLHVGLPSATRHRPPPQAYVAYLRGRDFLDRANPEVLNQAAECLETATNLDPEFARAWAWLSIVRESRVATGMARPNQAMPGSRDAAERAVALDPDLGDGHLALGIVKLQYDWDWAGAKAELDRAVQAIPGSAFALEWHAHWLETQGRMNEAISETERALALDPFSAAISAAAAAQYIALNQPERAIPYAQKAVGLNPDNASARAALANVLWLAGQKDKSRQVLEELRSSGAAAKLPASVLASLAARMGNPRDARQLLDEAEDLPDEELLPAVAYAGLAGELHDWDRLFSWMEEAYGERDVELPYWRRCPSVPKSDPRFEAFLAEMNLPPLDAR